MSDQPASLAAALAALQADLPRIGKDAAAVVEGENKAGRKFTYGYKYADLADVTAALMPRLGALGLSFMCRPMLDENGRFVLKYQLQHVSGEASYGDYPLPSSGSPQQIGSAITYARRYCLLAVTGAAPDDEDDDGQAAESARADGLPVNRDGSLSRSRTSDEEKDRAGVMTSAQHAEHTALQPKRAEQRPAERLATTPPDDTWYDYNPAAPVEERDYESPRTITRQQQGAMHAKFTALGITDRTARLAWTRRALRLAPDELASSSELSYRQAGDLLALLEEAARTGGMALEAEVRSAT